MEEKQIKREREVVEKNEFFMEFDPVFDSKALD